MAREVSRGRRAQARSARALRAKDLIRRSALPLASAALALASACTTLTPHQTASPVEVGVFRVGGHLSITPWCSVTANPFACARAPDGFPMPELRATARTGLAPRADLGLSLHGAPALAIGSTFYARGIRAGAQADGKYEVWSLATPEGRHLVSIGAGLGAAIESSAPEFGEALTIPEFEAYVPVFYGYQVHGWEWVASPRLLYRLSRVDVTGDGLRESVVAPWVGLALGGYSRGPTRLGLALEYAAPTAELNYGIFTLSVGVLFDLGGARAEPPR